ncbi:MAG: NAD-dependent DNA ligase LigA [Pelagibacteraceae bacterium TMED246]|nr:MAG: NAD-dependent DNA ligase LigA [Pelagibacteraceae bacterium TMED246]|tara:strand:+ start:3015 stop:5012 length:1998 start_codon:yes stop_codon:yes gene_type:complete
MNNKIKHKIESLIKKINYHNTQYYIHDNPIISDNEYDVLLKKLQSLENQYPELIFENSPTQRVGAKPLDKFSQVNHRIPLLSLSNAMNNQELELFNTQMKKGLNKKIEYVGEPKLDGLAVELIYENGKFTKGSTRGDGQVGEDITENLKTIKAIPLYLNNEHSIPSILEVRGEVFINHIDFKNLNQKRMENGESLFANPRNCAAGSLRQLDSSVTATRPLRIYCYAPGHIEGLIFNSQIEFLNTLPKWGLPVNQETQVGLGKDFLFKYFEYIESKRNDLPYDIDGVVFKINSYEDQKILGTRSRSPRWAIAAKLKAIQATTIIKNIITSVGRTGAITPVAQLKPVNVGGVIVSNATLHNQDEINKKNIRIGDTVVVQRAGDVIPEIVKVIIEKRLKNSEAYIISEICPSCGSICDKKEDEAVLRCLNPHCPAQVEGKIKHFVSKNCLDIDGLGEKIVQLLIKNKLIANISDIFELSHEQISSLERMGNKSAENIINSINKSKNTTMAKFIHGLGIRNVGNHLSKILEKHYNYNFDSLINAHFDELISIDEVGDIVADSIINFFKDENNLNIINRCFELGVTFSIPQQESVKLNKQIFVITGTLSELKRNEAKELIENNGGIVSSSVSKKTNYLLCGKNAGSKKKKAEDLKIKIINEIQLKDLLNG